MKEKKIKNGICIDTEGYTDISDRLPVKDGIALRNAKGVLKNTIKILEILDKTKTKGTFFIIASYVEQIPDIAIEIEIKGHEIGLHGYDHQPLYYMSKENFDHAIEKSLCILKKYTSQQIIGYQAPDFSLNSTTTWAFDVLIKKGFKYDCSIFPIKHPSYGIERFSRFPVCIKERFYEIPMPTIRAFGKNIPFGGGGYLRHFPYWVNKFCFMIYNKSSYSALNYVHPWEFEDSVDLTDVFELRKIAWFKKWRYFGSCGERFCSKFERLMQDFSFVPIREIYKDLINEDSDSDYR